MAIWASSSFAVLKELTNQVLWSTQAPGPSTWLQVNQQSVLLTLGLICLSFPPSYYYKLGFDLGSIREFGKIKKSLVVTSWVPSLNGSSDFWLSICLSRLRLNPELNQSLRVLVTISLLP